MGTACPQLAKADVATLVGGVSSLYGRHAETDQGRRCPARMFMNDFLQRKPSKNGKLYWCDKSRCVAGVPPRAYEPPCGSQPRCETNDRRGNCRRSHCEWSVKHAAGRAASSNAIH